MHLIGLIKTIRDLKVEITFLRDNNKEEHIMADVKVVTADNFQEEVLNADVPVLVDFWAVWCGPCKMLTPVVHEIAAEHPEIKVCSVNVDDEMELAQKFNIMSIPTLLVFNKGEMVDQMVGLQPKNVIEQKIAL